MIRGELEASDDDDCYEGYSDDGLWFVRVPFDVLGEAHHILIMRGISSPRHNDILYDANTWVEDATLRGLEGVEVIPARSKN